MYTITYHLNLEADGSEGFYKALRTYSHAVYQEMDELFYETAMDFFRFRIHEGVKTGHQLEVCYLEMLSLGVLWTVYSGDALATNDSTSDLLQKLFELREKNRHLKPIVDTFRGICLTAMMSPDLYDHMGIASPERANLTKLLDWLEATGEFSQEVKRLRHWERYLESLTDSKARNLLESILSTGLWFEQDSIEDLGVYTENVERYLNELRPKRYWKEDVIFCGRRRVEYHLNMVGGEWLNAAYRKAFSEKSQHLVLIPTCMRRLSEEDCRAELVGDWLVCQKCYRHCQVAQISRLEEQADFKLYMVPHSSSLKNSPLDIDPEHLGILGVSCVLNLISGGWMLADMNIPAQCVFLDYCGCKNHWHHEGIPTMLSEKRLLELLAKV